MPLPNKYAPLKKEQRIIEMPEVVYTIGLVAQKDVNNTAFLHGPTPNVKDMLQTVPEYENSRIIMLTSADHFVILYRWRASKLEWHRIASKRYWCWHENSDCVFIETEHVLKTTDMAHVDMVMEAVEYNQAELRKVYNTVFGKNNVVDTPKPLQRTIAHPPMDDDLPF